MHQNDPNLKCQGDTTQCQGYNFQCQGYTTQCQGYYTLNVKLVTHIVQVLYWILLVMRLIEYNDSLFVLLNIKVYGYKAHWYIHNYIIIQFIRGMLCQSVCLQSCRPYKKIPLKLHYQHITVSCNKHELLDLWVLEFHLHTSTDL